MDGLLDPTHETYYVVGLTGAHSTTRADDAVGHLWNPSSSRRIKVWECYAYTREIGTTNQKFGIARTTTRGTTPNNTVTPDADNAAQGDHAPPSGAVLEMGQYATAPVIATPYLRVPCIWGTDNTNASDGFWAIFPEGIIVPPGTGLAITYVLSDFFANPFTAGFIFDD